MSKLTDTLPDIRFSFDYLSVAPTKALQTKLEEAIEKNPSDFKEVNWITDSRNYNISTMKNKKFEDKSIGKTLDENPELADCVKDVLKGISENIKLDSDLVNYIRSDTISNENDESNNLNIPGTEENDDEGDNDEEGNDDERDNNYNENNENNNNLYSSYFSNPSNLSNDIETFNSSSLSSNDMTTYPTVPGRLISYFTVCEITKAVSRSRLTLPKKDESVKYAEERERYKLKQELEKYMKLNPINAELQSCFNVDVEQMTLKQLQTYSAEAKQMYEKMKITDVMMEGIDGIDKLQQTVFKNGVKIPGTKKVMKLNNFSGAIRTLLTDKNKTMYVAYGNLIDKYNLRVSDEMLGVMNIISTLYKNIEIVDAPDVKGKKKDEESEDSFAENSLKNEEDDEKDNEESEDEEDDNEESESESE